MKKLLTIGLTSALLLVSATGCGSTNTETPASEPETPAVEQEAPAKGEATNTSYKDGTYTASLEDFDDMGLKDVVTIEVVDGKIASADWNQDLKDGGDRKTMSKENPIMVEQGGAQAPWYEQADRTATYFVDTQDLTKPDAISGVSIDLDEFYDLAQKALAEAQ